MWPKCEQSMAEEGVAVDGESASRVEADGTGADVAEAGSGVEVDRTGAAVAEAGAADLAGGDVPTDDGAAPAGSADTGDGAADRTEGGGLPGASTSDGAARGSFSAVLILTQLGQA